MPVSGASTSSPDFGHTLMTHTTGRVCSESRRRQAKLRSPSTRRKFAPLFDPFEPKNLYIECLPFRRERGDSLHARGAPQPLQNFEDTAAMRAPQDVQTPGDPAAACSGAGPGGSGGNCCGSDSVGSDTGLGTCTR